MSRYLVFQLYAPLVSWGEPAVGEVRHTALLPSRSALLGLLAAALGIRREEEQRLLAFNAHYHFAVRPFAEKAGWLRDYHTVQVPKENKKRSRYTRRDELCQDPGFMLETILSTREYHCDLYYHVAVSALAEALVTLESLQSALISPVFPLYLGRKCCSPGLPLDPRLLTGNLSEVFAQAQQVFSAQWQQIAGEMAWSGGEDCYWEQPGEVGITPISSSIRTDNPLSRRRWQFGERVQYRGALVGRE